MSCVVMMQTSAGVGFRLDKCVRAHVRFLHDSLAQEAFEQAGACDGAFVQPKTHTRICLRHRFGLDIHKGVLLNESLFLDK